MGLNNPFKWAENQGDKFLGSIKDNLDETFNGNFLDGVWGLTENVIDVFTLGFYSKVKQVIDSLQPPDLPAQTYQGRSQMSTGSNTPKQFVYGRCRIGGQLTYWTPTGTDSEFMHMVVTLAPHKLASYSRVYFNDELAYSFDGVTVTIEEKYQGFILQHFEVLTPQTTANATMIAEMPEWTTDHVGRDHAYLYLKLKYDKEVFNRGMPSVSIDVIGKDVYSPTLGYNIVSNNHALACLDYILSPSGLNASLSEVDTQSFIVGETACNEQVAGIDGTESRYTVDGTLEYSANPIDNLNALREAGKALLNYEQGTWQYVAGTYTAPIMDLDESDLVGGISVMTGPSKADLVNTIKGSYLDPRQDFEVVQFPEMSIQTYINRDKEKLTAEVSAPFATTPTMARRLGKLIIEQSRFGVRMQASFKFRTLKLLPGDRVTFSSARLGWDKKIFRIVGGGQSINLSSGVDLTLAEDSPDVWDWTEGEALDVTAPPALTLADSTISKPVNISATEQLYSTNVQNIIKARVILTWERGGVRSSFFNIQARKDGEAEFKDIATNWSGTQLVIEDSEVTEFDYRIQGVTDIGRLSDWTTYNYTVLGKSAPPADVLGLTAVQKSYGIDVSWQAVPDADLQEYELRTDTDFGGAGSLYTGRQLRFTDIRRAQGVTYYIKAIDTSGNYSTNSVMFTPNISVPTASSSLNVTSQDNYIELRWASSASIYPISFYRIRRGDVFATAKVLGEVTGTFHMSKEEEAGTYQYWVYPVDAAGQEGLPVSSITSVDAASDYVLRVDDYVNYQLMDTLTNVAIGEGGGGFAWDDTQQPWDDVLLRWDDAPSPDLIGPVNNTETFIENMQRSGLTYDAAQGWDDMTQAWDDEALLWDNIGGDPYGKKAENGFTHWLDPSLGSGIAERIIDFDALIPNTRITVVVDYTDLRVGATLKTILSTSDDAVTWTVFPDNQLEINSSNFQYLRIRHEIDSPGATGLIRINSTRFKLDVKQKTDQGQADILASDTTGTEVFLNKSFIDIDSVVATPRDEAGKILAITFEDVGNQDRFKVRAFDRATGNRVDATISWMARGS